MEVSIADFRSYSPVSTICFQITMTALQMFLILTYYIYVIILIYGMQCRIH